MTNSNRDLLILGLDTSSSRGAVGLIRGDKTLANRAIPTKGTFSEKLLTSIQDLLLQAEITLADLDLLAVTQGPGSFTGLRIGLATIKGLAYTLDRPVVGVLSLEVLARGTVAEIKTPSICLPARPGWLYTAKYQCGENGLKCLQDPLLEPFEQWAGRLEPDDTPFGEGVLKYKSDIQEIVPQIDICDNSDYHYPRGDSVARLGYEKYLKTGGQKAEEVVPVYLQPSMAEVRWEQKQEQASSSN